jgi:hypothetical protein
LTTLKLGDRVRVSGHWNFPDDCTGVVAQPPDAVRALLDDEGPRKRWRGHIRSMRGRDRVLTFVWIEFDERQRDGDGDGPYRGGEVELAYITRLED